MTDDESDEPENYMDKVRAQRALHQFKPGNRFWEARSSYGPRPQFETPEHLWHACCQYFVWNEENPLYEDNVFVHKGEAFHEPKLKIRAMTLNALTDFIGTTPQSWQRWRREREDLFEVIQRADRVIQRQKFEGAAADMLNPAIIARDLGMVDRTVNQTQQLDKDGNPVDSLDTAAMKMMQEALAKIEAAKKAVDGES